MMSDLMREFRRCDVRRRPLLALGLLCLLIFSAHAAAVPAQKHVVLIAGPKSHGPVGNGIHDYGWSVKLLAAMLKSSRIRNEVRVSYFPDGWPEDPAALDSADTVMVISDGRDGDKYAEAPFLENPERLAQMDRLMKRGCGFVTFHFSTFAPDVHADRVLDWVGGYFDWETDGRREWYSAITTVEAEVQPVAVDHPINRGIHPFTMKEEYYYNIRFHEADAGVTPLWKVPALMGREPLGSVVAWARERADGGRGFGTTCGHFYANWEQPMFRKLILNALAWTARLEVPPSGMEAPYLDLAAITQVLEQGTRFHMAEQSDRVRPIRALILTGRDGPFHPWLEKTIALRTELQRDRRFQVTTLQHPQLLSEAMLSSVDVLLLNYCNWEDPEPLNPNSRQALVTYLKEGGGLVILHFANGAWHFSLPKAGASDWPEYRRICRRVWNHDGDSGHDAYGPFRVEITPLDHPITQGMRAWETKDELYFNQSGDEPIEALITARAQETGKDEPLAWAYDYGQGRVFQTLLGHDAASIHAIGTAELLRRGAAWAAGRDPNAPPPTSVMKLLQQRQAEVGVPNP